MANYGQPWSERFGICTVPNVYTQYTVPAGKRAVVKSFLAVNDSSGAGAAYLLGPGVLAAVAYLQAKDSLAWAGIQLVAYPGEVLSLLNTVAGLHSSMHGYLLDADPAKGPPENSYRRAYEADELPADFDPLEGLAALDVRG